MLKKSLIFVVCFGFLGSCKISPEDVVANNEVKNVTAETHPEPERDDLTLRFTVMTDIHHDKGDSPLENTYFDEILGFVDSMGLDFSIMAGDYSTQNASAGSTKTMLKFLSYLNKESLNIPFLFTFGNHDYPDKTFLDSENSPQWMLEGQSISDYFLRLGKQMDVADFVSAQNPLPFNYSFIAKNQLFIMLYPPAVYSMTKAHIAWLDGTLADAVSRQIKNVFVITHWPLMGKGTYRRDGMLEKGTNTNFSNLLTQYTSSPNSLKIYHINGHEHVFVHTKELGGRVEQIISGSARGKDQVSTGRGLLNTCKKSNAIWFDGINYQVNSEGSKSTRGNASFVEFEVKQNKVSIYLHVVGDNLHVKSLASQAQECAF